MKSLLLAGPTTLDITNGLNLLRAATAAGMKQFYPFFHRQFV